MLIIIIRRCFHENRSDTSLYETFAKGFAISLALKYIVYSPIKVCFLYLMRKIGKCACCHDDEKSDDEDDADAMHSAKASQPGVSGKGGGLKLAPDDAKKVASGEPLQQDANAASEMFSMRPE